MITKSIHVTVTTTTGHSEAFDVDTGQASTPDNDELLFALKSYGDYETLNLIDTEGKARFINMNHVFSLTLEC